MNKTTLNMSKINYWEVLGLINRTIGEYRKKNQAPLEKVQQRRPPLKMKAQVQKTGRYLQACLWQLKKKLLQGLFVKSCRILKSYRLAMGHFLPLS